MTGLSACRTAKPEVVVIRSDQVLVRMPAGTNYTAEVDGWFMSDATYQKVRRAIADRILELEPPR